MRWEVLFEDLHSQLEAAERQELADVALDLAEAEATQVTLADRLRARLGQELCLRLRDGRELRGVVVDAAAQWLLLGEEERRALLPLTAIGAAWPLGGAAPPAGQVERNLRVTHALREIARQGVRVAVLSQGGDVTGWITRVGADHIDVHADGGSTPGGVVSVPLAALLAVRSG